jgi:chromosome partitioning protein
MQAMAAPAACSRRRCLANAGAPAGVDCRLECLHNLPPPIAVVAVNCFHNEGRRVIAHPALHRSIATINGKGGTLKTSITANVGGLLAAAGYRVLLIDLEPQGNLAQDLGYTHISDEGEQCFTAVSAGAALTPFAARDNLDVVAGGERLHDLAAVILSRQQRGDASLVYRALATSLAPTATDYDFVIIDCPPGEEVLQQMALGAARWVLIPTKTDASSRIGLSRVAKQFQLARHHNPGLALLGVAIVGLNLSARRVHARARATIEEELEGTAPVFEAVIRHAEAVAVDARDRGQLIHELERDGMNQPKWYEQLRASQTKGERLADATKLAGDYQAMAEEIARHLIGLETQGEVPA